MVGWCSKALRALQLHGPGSESGQRHEKCPRNPSPLAPGLSAKEALPFAGGKALTTIDDPGEPRSQGEAKRRRRKRIFSPPSTALRISLCAHFALRDRNRVELKWVGLQLGSGEELWNVPFLGLRDLELGDRYNRDVGMMG